MENSFNLNQNPLSSSASFPSLVNPGQIRVPASPLPNEHMIRRLKTIHRVRETAPVSFFSYIIDRGAKIENFVSPIGYEDATRFTIIEKEADRRGKIIRYGFAAVLFAAEWFVASKSMAFRITQRDTLGRFFVKLFVLPIFATKIIDACFFSSQRNAEFNSIMSKYNFHSQEFEDAIRKICEKFEFN